MEGDLACILAAVRVLVGTSGYSYAEWKGRGKLYPQGLPAKRMLAHYATRLPTVEINNSFRKLPTAKTVDAWAGEVPKSFVFALKAPQQITHWKRLSGARPLTRKLVQLAARLGPRRGPLLFQLPPNFKKDIRKLEAFLETLGALARTASPLPPESALRVAFEFRHPSWFESDVYGALRAHGAAVCIAEGEGLATPFVATADWGYLRLRLGRYGPKSLAAWAERIAAQPWADAFVFFKHDEGKAPRYARQLLLYSHANGEKAGP